MADDLRAFEAAHRGAKANASDVLQSKIAVMQALRHMHMHLERAAAKLQTVIPLTLAVIFILLYCAFRSAAEALLLMLTVPFALIGGFWFVWVLGHAISVATAVGFIALAGLAAEFGVVMLIYLRNALNQRLASGHLLTQELIDEAVREGAVSRVRPKAMTVAVILAGLVPIMFGSGAGSEVMQRIAAPMVGGMITAPLLSLFVLPAAWRLLQQRRLKKQQRNVVETHRVIEPEASNQPF